MYTCMYGYMYVCTYAWLYVCKYTCIHPYVYIPLPALYLFSRIQIRFIIRVNERTMCVDDSNYPVCLIVSNYMNFCKEKKREERTLAHTIIRHFS